MLPEAALSSSHPKVFGGIMLSGIHSSTDANPRKRKENMLMLYRIYFNHCNRGRQQLWVREWLCSKKSCSHPAPFDFIALLWPCPWIPSWSWVTRSISWAEPVSSGSSLMLSSVKCAADGQWKKTLVVWFTPFLPLPTNFPYPGVGWDGGQRHLSLPCWDTELGHAGNKASSSPLCSSPVPLPLSLLASLSWF